MSDPGEIFIQKATKKHNGKYAYSAVNYVNSRTKVEIICRKHGAFKQTPAHHLFGSGCPACKAESISERCRKTADEFLNEAEQVHKGRYDYSAVVYTTIVDKVEIRCRIHGPFLQRAGDHLNGCGCPKCKGDSVAKRRKQSTEDFILSAQAVHGDRYDYSISNYTFSNKKVEILCKDHGPFWQLANDHTSGAGCPACATVQKAAKMRVVMCKTPEEFIEDAQIVHKGLYDYSKTEYKNSSTNVVITCPIHGDFIKRPTDHLAGGGCQACSSKGFNKNGEACIYVLSQHNKVKVGITGKGGKKRAREISLSYGSDFEVCFEMWGKGHIVQKVEKEVLSILRGKYKSPTTVFEGYTECFLDVDVITVIDMIYEAMERLK